MEKKLELRIDHITLKYLSNHHNLNATQTRWLEFLNKFDFKIKYMKQKINEVVDVLNKNSHLVALSVYKII